MATATTVPTTRAEIFKQGLKDATGTIIFWDRQLREDGTFSRGEWGKLALDIDPSLKYYAPISIFSEEDRQFIQKGCRVIFDFDPNNQPKTNNDGKRRKDPKACKARLIVVNQ